MTADAEDRRKAAAVSTSATLQWIAHATGKHLWHVVALCLLQAATALLAIWFALIMKSTIDAAVAGDRSEFVIQVVCFCALILGQIVLGALIRYTRENARSSVENSVRTCSLRGILSQPYAFASGFHTATLMTRLTSDVNAIVSGVTELLPSIVSIVVRVVGSFGVIFVLAPNLALIFLVLGCCLALASLLVRGWIRSLYARMQEAESAMRCIVQECLDNLLIVRVFSRRGEALGESTSRMQTHKSARMKRNFALNVCNTGIAVGMRAGYLIGFVWCGWQLLNGSITYGTLMAIIQLINQIQSPFVSAGGVFSLYTAMIMSAHRLMEVSEPHVESTATAETAGAGDVIERNAGTDAWAPFDSPDALRASRARNEETAHKFYEQLSSIEVSHMSFEYEDELVFDDLNLSIPRGGFTVLAGRSGVGKSTLLLLLLGAYLPKEGSIALHGENGTDTNPADAPTLLYSYVPQGNQLFSGSIRYAVSFEHELDAEDEQRLHEACRIACADTFIAEQPDGYDTVLGEHGSGLSEGQRQRLAIARAVYSQSPLMLLDEATSALDAATERSVLENLKNLEGRTIIAATHGECAKSMADAIIDLER